jgi:hypothetical protein
MDHSEDWRLLTERLVASWVVANPSAPPATVPRTPIVLGDRSTPPPADGRAFLRAELRPEGQAQVSIGSPGSDRIRRRGSLLLHLHVARTSDANDLFALVDASVAVFAGWHADRLVCATPSLVRLDLRGAWSVAVVAVPFTRDSV